jgi:hypothetical protein
MESKLAREARQELIADTRLMTSEERLNAFLEHCQWVAALHDAGQQLRAGSRAPKSQFSPRE